MSLPVGLRNSSCLIVSSPNFTGSFKATRFDGSGAACCAPFFAASFMFAALADFVTRLAFEPRPELAVVRIQFDRRLAPSIPEHVNLAVDQFGRDGGVSDQFHF